MNSGLDIFFSLFPAIRFADEYKSISDWWFGTWLLFFHLVGNVIIPTDELHHFSEGLKPQPDENFLWITKD
jgi:hypothetical protein